MIYKEIFQRIEQRWQVVTPTQSLAQSLQKSFAAQQIEDKRLAWPSADIASWYGWCHDLWQRLIFDSAQHPQLLSTMQSLQLWQQVIDASPYSRQLLQLQATARQVQAAWQLFNNWQLEAIPEQYYLNQDAYAFKLWMQSYQSRLQAEGWLDEATLPMYLAQHASAISPLPEHCALYAFDELLPVQRRLLDALSTCGLHIEHLRANDNNQSVGIMSFQDQRSEYVALGNWVRQCVRNDPDARLGIVLPNLRAKRQSLVRQLERTLVPENFLLDGVKRQRPFTIASGKPLSEYPLIHIAIQLLQMNVYRIQLDTLSVILRSPFIQGHSQEAAARCLFDARLRALGQPTISYQTLFVVHDQCADSERIPVFIDALKDFYQQLQNTSGRKNLQQWSRTFFEFLQCFGWPGERSLNSDEYQTVEAWHDCLQTLASIDKVSQACGMNKALSCLVGICRDKSFQPQTELSNLQVIGMEGASGMQFDHCWILGLHDQAWPAHDAQNPFIPLSLQRDAGVTNSSPLSQLQAAERITAEIVRSAKHIVLSYPLMDADSELRPSPVLQHYAKAASTPTVETEFTEAMFHQQQLQYLSEDHAPPIASDSVVRGGTALFKDQAACPFRAFAKHRLAARAIDTTEVGLAALDRGSILHRALDIVWQGVKNSEHMQTMSAADLQQQIANAVDKAVNEHAKIYAGDINQQLYVIERQRLQKLIAYWFQYEAQRPGFSVKATETVHDVTFAAIKLRMRIDRIDELADGRLLIIDYKTGAATPNSWFGQRPDEPQLPLYAVTSVGDVAGIAFASLQVDAVGFVGLALSDVTLPGAKPVDDSQWQSQLTEWHHCLTNLANEYRLGVARVEPMPGACRYCDLASFCRIKERQQSIIEDSE